MFESRREERGWKPRLLYQSVPIESEAHDPSLTHKFNRNEPLDGWQKAERRPNHSRRDSIPFFGARFLGAGNAHQGDRTSSLFQLNLWVKEKP